MDTPRTHSVPANAISAADVRRVAKLARLELTDEQLESYRAPLSAVLGYMDGLRKLDLENVEPMSHPNDAANRLGADEPGPTLSTDALIAIAPETMGPFVKVPKVLGDGAGA